MAVSAAKIVVGREEWCGFRSLGIPAIKARVDSGARTSSLHAFNIQAFKRHGASWVSFEVHPLQNNRKTVVRCESPVVDRRLVKSSTGIAEKRYVIRVPIDIGGDSWDIEVTLANRDSMGYRMLLGREAMSGRMLVDPAARYCLGEVSEKEIGGFYGKIDKSLSGLKIALLAGDRELYSNQRILEAGDERGHEMLFLNLKHCFMKLDANAPEVHYRGGRVLNDLDAVITRIPPSMTFYGCALARQFESMGVYTMNSSAAISQSRDKLYLLQLLLQNGLDIPTTGFASSPLDSGDLIDMVGGAPLIVKLLEGMQGRGVVLADSKKAGESVISAIKALRANLLVQEYVREAQGKDISCFVVEGKVVASIQREVITGDVSPNLRRGGQITVIKPDVEEKKLAVKAARVLGVKVAGIDIIRSDKGPLLLDINATPGLETIENATGKDLAGLLITSVEKKLGWKRELAVEKL
ncbi:30S ribosomal protein S6--L-glutamate ligase [Kaarinaea lacus]